MRYDAGRKQRTRERVLTEAARALRSDGPNKLGVAEVMSRAGLTHGGFYAHFASKEQLLAEATDFAFDAARIMFEAAVEGREPRAALVCYIDRYLSMQHRDSPDLGCPVPALAGDVARMGGEVCSRFAANVHHLTARLQLLLGASGVTDAEALAPSVVAELVGALSLARATPDRKQAARLLAASRAALAKRLDLEIASSASQRSRPDSVPEAGSAVTRGGRSPAR